MGGARPHSSRPRNLFGTHPDPSPFGTRPELCGADDSELRSPDDSELRSTHHVVWWSIHVWWRLWRHVLGDGIVSPKHVQAGIVLLLALVLYRSCPCIFRWSGSLFTHIL